ncbi:MAG: GntR family transcriptional regulator [Pseudonocardiaceae bacterium]|nr:GntR family transcriptional regulator [Pseudonocardiaceae bacterium]
MEDITRPEGLYRQVASRLRQEIDAGRYRPGDPLPSESRLCAHYGVSRQTVRQAVTVLASEGLVTTERGRGTFVRSAPLRLAFSRFSRDARHPGAGPFEAVCESLGIPGYGELVTVERRVADDDVATGLKVAVGSEVVYRRRYMHAGDPDAIVQIQEGHLPLDVVDGTPLAGAAKLTGGTYAALDAIGHGPATATEEVTARMADFTEQEIFRLKTGVPVIGVTRTTRDADGRIVELLLVTAAADRNVFVYNDLPID